MIQYSTVTRPTSHICTYIRMSQSQNEGGHTYLFPVQMRTLSHLGRTFLLNKLDSQTAKLPYIVNAYPQQHPIESSLGKLLPMPWTLAHIRACQSLPLQLTRLSHFHLARDSKHCLTQHSLLRLRSEEYRSYVRTYSKYFNAYWCSHVSLCRSHLVLIMAKCEI